MNNIKSNLLIFGNNINTLIQPLMPYMIVNAIIYYILYIGYKFNCVKLNNKMKNIIKLLINITGKLFILSIVLIVTYVTINYSMKLLN
jgi:cytochrome c oxidase assembly factor CtaG